MVICGRLPSQTVQCLNLNATSPRPPRSVHCTRVDSKPQARHSRTGICVKRSRNAHLESACDLALENLGDPQITSILKAQALQCSKRTSDLGNAILRPVSYPRRLLCWRKFTVWEIFSGPPTCAHECPEEPQESDLWLPKRLKIVQNFVFCRHDSRV